jgi:polysaccharide biosynthesis protein PslA
MAMIAIAIRLDSPGPVIYRQRRHGRNNREFEVLKFRTMVSRVHGPCQQTTRDDPRVTRLGRFLRRSSLDELPQLWNVLRGDMSLVGPRPHPTDMRTGGRLGDEISHRYPHRHRVKPGLTGLAQVRGCRGATEFDDQLIQRLEHDIAYVENWSIWLDLKIILITPWRLLSPGGRAF